MSRDDITDMTRLVDEHFLDDDDDDRLRKRKRRFVLRSRRWRWRCDNDRSGQRNIPIG